MSNLIAKINSKTNQNENQSQLIFPDEKKQELYNAYKNTIQSVGANLKNTVTSVDPNLIQRAFDHPEFFSEIGKIIKKGLTNAVENMSNYVGLDNLNANLKEKLIAAQRTLESNDNLQELAIIGSLLLEAFMPFLDPLLEKLNIYAQDASERIGRTIINVIINTAEEVPIYGIIIGTVRSIDNIIRTFLSTVTTSSKVIDEIRGVLEFTMDNFKSLKNEYMIQLQKEKNRSLNRIDSSIQKFNGGGR